MKRNGFVFIDFVCARVMHWLFGFNPHHAKVLSEQPDVAEVHKRGIPSRLATGDLQGRGSMRLSHKGTPSRLHGVGIERDQEFESPIYLNYKEV